jgi:competence protein ComGE
MLRKNDGFFLSEMLLSLAAFFMGAAVLLPIAIHVINQTMESERNVIASHLLFDELMYLKITGTGSGRGNITQNGDRYYINVTKNEGDSLWEVCVHYDDQKKCASSE